MTKFQALEELRKLSVQSVNELDLLRKITKKGLTEGLTSDEIKAFTDAFYKYEKLEAERGGLN